jgi:KUP system potassium uptake protein
VPGTAVFLTGNATGIPRALLHNFKHNKIIHAKTVLLTVRTDEIPYVPVEERIRAESLGEGMYRVCLRYGFSEDPDIPRALKSVPSTDLKFEPMQTTFFLGRETLLIGRRRVMAKWRKRLFAFMSHNALDATRFFNIPPGRVVELGIQVEV